MEVFAPSPAKRSQGEITHARIHDLINQRKEADCAPDGEQTIFTCHTNHSQFWPTKNKASGKNEMWKKQKPFIHPHILVWRPHPPTTSCSLPQIFPKWYFPEILNTRNSQKIPNHTKILGPRGDLFCLWNILLENTQLQKRYHWKHAEGKSCSSDLPYTQSWITLTVACLHHTSPENTDVLFLVSVLNWRCQTTSPDKACWWMTCRHCQIPCLLHDTRTL